MTSLPLNLLDELYLNLDREQEPWTVHYEVRLETHLDPERLATAVAAAAGRHPLARARLASWRLQDRGYNWEIADELDEVPLRLAVCTDEAALAVERERLFRTSPSLAAAPPFAVVLARCPEGDSLMLNLHHAAGDGVSAERFMLSILREYAGEFDPVPPQDPLAVHDVHELAAARSWAERRARRRALRAGAWRAFVPVARIARDGGNDRAAYGFEMFVLSADESRKLFTRRPQCTTVNDVLLAGLAIAIERWNAEHGCPELPIALSMPVNLRPAEWRLEIFSNFASWMTVWARAGRGEDLNSVAAGVAARTGAIKRDRLGGLTVDLLEIPGRLMIAAQRWLQYMTAFTANAVVDTASLSNLGTIAPLPSPFDGRGTKVWFTPPCQMPLGVGIGAVTHEERLHVSVRYRYAQFDHDAARRFTDLYRGVLVG
jgi:NRPS condensation-like uncharacterized protein